MFWQKWLTQRFRWIPTLLILPFLYFLGWITVQPLGLFRANMSDQDLSLLGTIITFICFLLVLPSWVKIRWMAKYQWKILGLSEPTLLKSIFIIWKGFLWSILLLFFLSIIILCSSLGEWVGEFNFISLFNAIALRAGVAFAEELIFRSWLWGEANIIFGSRYGLFVQAAIFSLAHLSFHLDVIEVISLFVGLFLLGLILAIRRVLDKGSLFGSIGLHGGLIGLWFLVDSGLINILDNKHSWLIVSGNTARNPIGGLIAIFTLLIIILYHRTAFAIALEPLNGACNASSNGATP